MSSSIELIGLGISPYSIRAKWALDHHQIPYRYHEHLLIFGVPYVRWRLRRFLRGFTVPALIDGDTRLMDSYDIARYADERGKSAKLFPKGKEEAIREFNQLSERACDAGRAIVSARVLKDSQAQRAVIPEQYPGWLRTVIAWLTPIGIAYLNWGFHMWSRPLSEHEKTAREAFEKIRATLKTSGGEYLLGEFTYADVTMVAGIHAMSPTPGTIMATDPVLRRCWTQDHLIRDYADVFAWRDRVVAKHFPARKRSAA